MADKSETTYLGMTSKQAVLIGVLLVVFVGVILFGQGGDAADTTVETAITTESNQLGTGTQNAMSVPTSRATHWPKVSLAEMLQHNPFEQPAELQKPPLETITPSVVETETPPAETPAPELAALEKERQQKMAAALREFQNQKVKVILRTNQKVSAVIGDRLIHEGDVIDGIRIVSILPNGVIVAPADGD